MSTLSEHLKPEDVEVTNLYSDFNGAKIYWTDRRSGEHYIAYEQADWWLNRGDPVVEAARKKYGYKD